MSEVWYRDPTVLLNESDFFPCNYNNQTNIQRINAIARTSFVLILFILLFHKSPIKGIIIVLIVMTLLTIIVNADVQNEKFTIEQPLQQYPLESFNKQVAWVDNYEAVNIQPNSNQIMARTKQGFRARPNNIDIMSKMMTLNKQYNNDPFSVVNKEEMFGRDHFSRGQLRSAIGESNKVGGITYNAPRESEIIKKYLPQSYYDQLGFYQLAH